MARNEKDEFDVLGDAALIDYELSQVPNTRSEEGSQFDTSNDDSRANDDLMDNGKLYEQLCTLKGENRYLRSTNEKLDFHVKNIDKENKAAKLMHEEESKRQHEAMNVNLAFKNKEIHDLTDKCRLLNDQLSQHVSTTSLGCENNGETFARKVHVERPRKRTRPSSSYDNDELEPSNHLPLSLLSGKHHSNPVLSSLPQWLIITCRTNAILASECNMNSIKQLIKSLVVDKSLCDSEHQQHDFSHTLFEDECSSSDSDELLDESSSDSKWSLNNSFQTLSNMSSSKESVVSEDLFNVISSNATVPCQSESDDCHNLSSYCLKSMFDVYDSNLQHANCLNSSMILLDTVCSSTNAILLKFIEDSLYSFYNTVLSTANTLESSTNSSSLNDGLQNGSSCCGHIETRKEIEYSASSSSSQTTPLHYSSPLSCYTCSSVSSESTLSFDSQGSAEITKSSPTKVDILQVLNVLKTLCTHDKNVCEALVYSKLTNEVLDDFTTFQEQKMTDDGCSSDTWHNQHTQELMKFSENSIPAIGALSSRVLLPKTQFGSLCESLRPKPGSCHYYYNGILLSLLMKTLIILGSLQKKQRQTEILNTILEILVLLSDECDPELLERYSILIQKDHNTLESLLRREDPVVALNVLTLLTKISHSSYNVALLCSCSKSCVLGNCYSLFSKPPFSTDSEITLLIWIQLVRFISQVLSTDGGEGVLLESECGCSVLLMQYLLVCLVDVLLLIDSLDEDCQFSNKCYSLIIMMLTVTQTILHHEKQSEYLRQNVMSRHRCLYSINCCLSWTNHISEEVLQDIYQQLVSDNETEDNITSNS